MSACLWFSSLNGLCCCYVPQESKSSDTEVTLFPLTRKSKGNYKCEVSTDAPNFPTVVEDANMTVIGKHQGFVRYTSDKTNPIM